MIRFRLERSIGFYSGRSPTFLGNIHLETLSLFVTIRGKVYRFTVAQRELAGGLNSPLRFWH